MLCDMCIGQCDLGLTLVIHCYNYYGLSLFDHRRENNVIFSKLNVDRYISAGLSTEHDREIKFFCVL